MLRRAEAEFLGDMGKRAFRHAQGLPRRPWFVHQVYAPGFYTGYGVKTLPAVRESLEQREWAQAEEQARIVVLAVFHAARDPGNLPRRN